MVKVMVAPMMAPATPRPMRSMSTSGSSGAVSQSVCVRSPTAKPAMSAPSTIIRPDAASVSGDHPPIAVGLRASATTTR